MCREHSGNDGKRTVTLYRVDFGDERYIIPESNLPILYENVIDKKEYPTFEDWMWDMKRSGLVRKIRSTK